ncbi:MAG: BF3164 family lipoprotein [bacterium]
MRLYFNIFLLFIGIPVCGQVSFEYSLNVDPKAVITDVYISEIFEEYSFIELETNSESLLGRAYVAEIHGDNLYILDRGGEMGVTVFSLKDGAFISSISHQGRGPGEYLFPFDFTVDDNGMIYLIDGSKVHQFDSFGKYIKNYNLDYPADRIEYFTNDRFALSASYKAAEVAITNRRFKILKEHFPYKIFRNGHSNILQSISKDCYYLKKNSGEFFRIDEYYTTPFLKISFKGYVPNKEITDKAIKDLGSIHLTINNHYENEIKKKGFYPSDLLINREQMYGKIFHDNDQYILRYSFISRKYLLYDINEIKNDISGDKYNFNHFVLTDDNRLICLIEPYRLLKMNKADIDPVLHKLTKRLKEDDNPILFIGKLKSF